MSNYRAHNAVDITGKKYGMLTAICYSHTIGKVSYYTFECECGAIKTISGQAVKRGGTISCGCHRKAITRNAQKIAVSVNTTHGMTKTRTYRIWQNMKARCKYNSHPYYNNYGGRGIKVCKAWESSFESFVNDMGYAEDGMSIDRINNDLGYSKENCRWSTRQDQGENMRITKLFFGKTLKHWHGCGGQRPKTVHERIRTGWPPLPAIFTPIGEAPIAIG